MSFNAHNEAIKIETMAQARLDAPADTAKDLSKKLTDEWSGLTQVQRDQVALSIQAQFTNHAINTLPVPWTISDGHGHCIALVFNASTFDNKTDKAAIEVWTSATSKGEDKAEISIRHAHEKRFTPESTNL